MDYLTISKKIEEFKEVTESVFDYLLEANNKNNEWKEREKRSTAKAQEANEKLIKAEQIEKNNLKILDEAKKIQSLNEVEKNKLTELKKAAELKINELKDKEKYAKEFFAQNEAKSKSFEEQMKKFDEEKEKLEKEKAILKKEKDIDRDRKLALNVESKKIESEKQRLQSIGI